MRAGETKTAAASAILGRPHDHLRFAFRDGFPDCGIAAVGSVRSTQSVRRRNRTQNRRDVPHALAEFHVVVPFVVDFEGVNAARDRMIWQSLEIRGPSGIHRPVGQKVTTNPFEKSVAGRALGHFDRVMSAAETNSFFNELVDNLTALGAIKGMTSATVTVEKNSGSAFEGFRRILRPAVGIDLRANSRDG